LWNNLANHSVYHIFLSEWASSCFHYTINDPLHTIFGLLAVMVWGNVMMALVVPMYLKNRPKSLASSAKFLASFYIIMAGETYHAR